MKYLKQTVSVLSAMTTAVCTVGFIDMDYAMSEGTYNVQLKVDTVEIDIDEIPEDRWVNVGISIDNNPGFLSLGYNLEIDGRLQYNDFISFDTDLNELVAARRVFKNTTSVLFINQGHVDIYSLYTENEQILNLKLLLPEEISINDFFEIIIHPYYDDGYSPGKIYFRRENSYDSYYDESNFATPINGGIKITGKTPPAQNEHQNITDAPVTQNQTQAVQTQNSPEPVQAEAPKNEEPQIVQNDNQNNPEPQNNQNTEKTPEKVTEKTTVKTEITVSSSETAESTSVSSNTSLVTSITKDTTVSTEAVSQPSEDTETTENTETSEAENPTDNNAKKTPLILLLPLAAAAAIISAIVIKKKF